MSGTRRLTGAQPRMSGASPTKVKDNTAPSYIQLEDDAEAIRCQRKEEDEQSNANGQCRVPEDGLWLVRAGEKEN